ncbi:hypothetical protein N7517_002948 [Penicillium concentricum]|uniref:Uncharacterized protein n=1 Tax=Penicillium concentricum TaxID=293559 RepID=A0A9W9SUR3_9EURO|nr:uncharacterized protein N7517_002948 [Penicillium concentricum]KAJ5385037.1 hypothetical protein N7517_002948 [Penicillium concentricum]
MSITLPSHEVFVPLTHPVIVGHTTTNHRAIREDESSPEALWPKLKELEELAEDHCIHPGLQDVLDLLDPTDCVDEEEDDGEEDEDEEGYEEEDEDNAHQAQP